MYDIITSGLHHQPFIFLLNEKRDSHHLLLLLHFPLCSPFFSLMKRLILTPVKSMDKMTPKYAKGLILWAFFHSQAWSVGVCVGCVSETSYMCTQTHTRTHKHWGDTVTVIRPSQASACACNLMWSFTFYMTVGHLALNLCRPCPLSMHSEGRGLQIEGVTQRPSFDLCYCFYSTRHCSDTLGFWKALMDAQVMQMLCVYIR